MADRGDLLRSAALGVLALAVLASCGFEPLMSQSTHPQVQSEMQRIRIAAIEDRSGQILRNYLIDALTPRGVQSSQNYLLTIRLYEPRREVAIRRDDTASRLAYTARATFQLSDGQRVIFGGSSSSETTFEVTNSEFATLSGQASARDRALQEVSQDIRQQLAVYFAGKAAPQSYRR
jgi:LPS-assembly lipoprotein